MIRAFVIVLVMAAVYAFLVRGPYSLRAAYDRDVARLRVSPVTSDVVTERDLGRLPDPVRRYLRRAGVVGQPRVHNVRVRIHGRIRSAADARWIPLEAEQYNFFDHPARMFYLTGSMFMIPVQGYHRYIGPSATMDVKAAALVPVARASGEEMDQGETVTMLNDMCVLAPATLTDPAIQWTPVDAYTARATFTNAGHTVHAELLFNESDELINFWSDDRFRAGNDGTMTRLRWSTPLRDYRNFGSVHLSAAGEARWHDPRGTYAYIELIVDSVEYNV